MGERRGSETCGQAKPLMIWQMFLDGPTTNGRPLDPKKFEGKWYGGSDEPENEFDQMVMIAKEGTLEGKWGYEKWANVAQKLGYKDDNTYWSDYMVKSSQAKLPRFQNNMPHFTDFTPNAAFEVAKDRTRWHAWLRVQWAHCVGNLGEDHPTCRKARWYYEYLCGPYYKNYHDELQELGHLDVALKYGMKPRVSFLPQYQPVKKNIPGGYEFYNSETYLNAYNPEGEGEIMFPFGFKD